jgi:glycosyltransferase involved in cell wall biosynthesis
MKVAVVTLNRGRGSGVVARHQVRALLARGHDASLVHSGEGSGELPVHEVALSLEVLPVHEYLPGEHDRQQPVSTMDADMADWFIGDFQASLRSLDPAPDLIIGHHANITAVATQRFAEHIGIPYVVFVHGTGIEPRHHGGYADETWEQIEEALRKANGIIVTTEYVRDALVRPIVDLPLDRFQIIPGGVDLGAYRPGTGDEVRLRYELPESYVISPGALTELKGPQNVVAASEKYSDLAPTIFLGDGDLRESLETAMGDRGRFLGYVPEADKEALISAATILAAAPEKLEHFGMVYAEALAAGTVPVAYDGGGVGAIVTPEVGVLTERRPEALGAAVRTLLERPDRRETMAGAGRRRAESRFDERALGDRLVDWVENIAEVEVT